MTEWSGTGNSGIFYASKFAELFGAHPFMSMMSHQTFSSSFTPPPYVACILAIVILVGKS
jgi:hypothetical protein